MSAKIIGYASDRDPQYAEFLCVDHMLPSWADAYPYAVTERTEHLAGSCVECVATATPVSVPSTPEWIYGTQAVPVMAVGSGRYVETPNGLLQCVGVERQSRYSVRLVFPGGYTWTMDTSSYVKIRNH